MSDPAGVGRDDAEAFLRERFAPATVDALEPLGGGAWSRAYGFTVDGRELVARFGRWREDYEADQRAMAWSGPDLPVPRLIEVGEAFGGAYALSERHHGVFLEDLDAERLQRLVPALIRLFDALRGLPPPLRRDDEATWREFLAQSLEDVPGERVSGWRAQLAADTDLDALWRGGEDALHRLLPACPELRHVLHLDLLHGNVLVAADGSRLEAVYDWGCTTFGDFAYELAWFSFWSPLHQGLAAIDVTAAVIEHLRSAGADLDRIDDRLRAYEIHIGLTHLAYHAFSGEPEALSRVAERLRPLVEDAARIGSPSDGYRQPMATDRTVFHVTPYVNSWKVKTEGAGPYEFEAVMDTKDEAERVAKEHARAQVPSQVIIHNQDGQISGESTYGDDPIASPG